MSGAHTLVDTYLIGAERATGIYAFNDEYALPLMGALNDRGIRIPQDIAIIGTDNVSFSAFVRPALTTINIDNVALGQRGIEMLVALDKGKPLSADLTQSPTPELIIRAST
jgi:DNA-binding LacI/PurR family transcriptional regulator